jgi:hypothetical protein
MNHAKQTRKTEFLLKTSPISLITQFLIKGCRVGGGTIPTISTGAGDAVGIAFAPPTLRYPPIQDALCLELKVSEKLPQAVAQFGLMIGSQP